MGATGRRRIHSSSGRASNVVNVPCPMGSHCVAGTSRAPSTGEGVPACMAAARGAFLFFCVAGRDRAIRTPEPRLADYSQAGMSSAASRRAQPACPAGVPSRRAQRSGRKNSEVGRKMIRILQNQNNDSVEFPRIKIMILTEVGSDSRNRK